MDIDISGWILEFLLRQDSLDNQLLNDLVTVLPLPNNNPKLKKLIILRKIESTIDEGTISELTLKFLEQIHVLDCKEGNGEASEAMKTAYCNVLMHCTAKLIKEGASDVEKYASDVKRIWCGGNFGMEVADVAKRVGFVEDELLRWVSDSEARVLDVNVCGRIVAKCEELDVIEAVRCYVNAVKEKSGPSFVESAFETVLSDRELSKRMGLDNDEDAEPDNHINNGADGAATVDVDANANSNSKGKETSRPYVQPRRKSIHPRISRRAGHGTHKGAKIIDPMETSVDIRNYISTPEVDKVQKDLEKSCFELHESVKDPLPEALRFAESIKVNTNEENNQNIIRENVVDNSSRVNVEASSSSHGKKGKAVEVNEEDGVCMDRNKRVKPSLMERNSTAHTIEWSDSIDSSEEASPTRVHLPSPKGSPRRAVSPLSVYKLEKISRHRKKKRWSVLEEDTLRDGVDKYGKGNWKMILSLYRDIFVERTEVDLKDKWRNLTR